MTDYQKLKEVLKDIGIKFEEFEYGDLKWIYVLGRNHTYYCSFEFNKETGKFKYHDIIKE